MNKRGIYFYVCPYETALFFCEEKDTGGVLLDCLTDLEQGERLCRQLRERYPDMPIAALIGKTDIPDMPATSLIRDCDTEVLFEEILEFCCVSCGWSIERLSTFSLTVTGDPQQTLYMGYPLLLSPCQHHILRCLFYRSPAFTTTDDLAFLCFPCEWVGTRNIAVQISAINRRAAKIDPRPLIVNRYKEGYRLRDGIL